MKYLAVIGRAGWRRVAFVVFCAVIVLAGVLYLGMDQNEVDRGFSKTLPPVLVLFGLIALVSPWLISRGALPPLIGDPMSDVPDSVRRRFRIAALIFMLVAGVLWAKRLDSSLWWDEVTSMRENIVGRWKHHDNAEGRMVRPKWPDTLLEYHTPNNHSLYSATARVTHEAMGGINDTDFSRPYFNEVALRLPAYVAGLLAIPLVGFLAFRFGSLATGCLAMGWMVLHPWILEFATSARGYSYAMLFLLLAVVAAVRIFRNSGGWRWWVAYGLGQVLAFTSIPTVTHMLVALNIAVFAGLLFDRSVSRGSRWPHVRAFFLTNLVALGLALAYFLPKLEALQTYLDSGLFETKVSWMWMANCVSNFITGQPYEIWEQGNPYAYATEQWPVWLLVLAIVFTVAIALSALVVSFRRGVFAFMLALAILLPPLTVFIQGKMSEFYMLPWYSVWQLPLSIALLSTGATGLMKCLPEAATRKPWVPGALAVLVLACIAAATQAPRRAYLTVPYEALRESAALIRQSPNPYAPGHEKVITTSLVSADHAYDPWNRRLRSEDEFWLQLEEAERNSLPFFCTSAWLELVAKEIPGVYEILTDTQFFEQIGEPLYGLHEHHTRYTFRYKPGTLAEQIAQRERPAE